MTVLQKDLEILHNISKNYIKDIFCYYDKHGNLCRKSGIKTSMKHRSLPIRAVAELVFKFSYETFHDEFRQKFTGENFEEVKFLDGVKSQFRELKKSKITKIDKELFNNIPGVKEDKSQRAAIFIYLLSYCCIGDNEKDWGLLISVIKYLLICKKSKFPDCSFFDDFNFVLDYEEGLKRLPKGIDKQNPEQITVKERNSYVKKRLASKIDSFNKSFLKIKKSEIENGYDKVSIEDEKRDLVNFWRDMVIKEISQYTYQIDMVMTHRELTTYANKESKRSDLTETQRIQLEKLKDDLQNEKNIKYHYFSLRQFNDSRLL